MTKWHVSITGTPAKCEAEIKDCPRGGSDQHFDTPEAAQAYFESTMTGSLISTFKKNSPKLKKMARVGATVSVALVSLVGVSNIANAAEPANAWLDDLDQITNQAESFLKDFESSIDKAAGEANDWLNKECTRESPANKKAEEIASKTPGFGQFKKFLESFGGISDSRPGSDFSATIQDDGSVLWQGKSLTPTQSEVAEAQSLLETLPIMPERDGRYDREALFGSNSNSTKAAIEQRDILDGTFNKGGRVVSGTLKDPYTGKSISFADSERPHDLEHLVALKEVYRSEDPNNPLTPSQREAIANDPNNLLLVESRENRSKSDKDVKGYLPSYEASQCRFAISTIQVKSDYGLTVDSGEYSVLSQVLESKCEVN